MSRGGWGIILGGWGWMGHFFEWMEVSVGGWVGHYFLWVRVSGDGCTV